MKTVLHINSGEASKQSELLANIQNLKEDETVEVDDIQVVVNSNAIEMVKKDSEASEFIRKFISSGVVFNACSNSLENLGIKNKEVIEDIKTVESGIGKLNKLQSEGYNYIKI